MTDVAIRSIDQQLRRWAYDAMWRYHLDGLPKDLWTKILMGGRWFFREQDIPGARRFVWRQVGKRWQYLHDDEIAEFIETEWGVECVPLEDRIAA